MASCTALAALDIEWPFITEPIASRSSARSVPAKSADCSNDMGALLEEVAQQREEVRQMRLSLMKTMAWPWSELQAAKTEDAASDLESARIEFEAGTDGCTASSSSRPARGSAPKSKSCQRSEKPEHRRSRTARSTSQAKDLQQTQAEKRQLKPPAQELSEPPVQQPLQSQQAQQSPQEVTGKLQGPLLVRRPEQERRTLSPDAVSRSPSPEASLRLCIMEPEHQLQPPQPPSLFRLPSPVQRARGELENWSFWKQGDQDEHRSEDDKADRTAPPIFRVHREGRFIFQPAFLQRHGQSRHAEPRKEKIQSRQSSVIVRQVPATRPPEAAAQSPRNSTMTAQASRSPSPTVIQTAVARQTPEPAGVEPASFGMPSAQPNLGLAVPKRHETPLPFPTALETTKEQRSEGLTPEGVARTASTATPASRQITPITPLPGRPVTPVASGRTPVSSGTSGRQVSSARQATPVPSVPRATVMLQPAAPAGEDDAKIAPRVCREGLVQPMVHGPTSPFPRPQVLLDKGTGDGASALLRLPSGEALGPDVSGSPPLIRFVSQPLTLTPSTSAGSMSRWLEPMSSGDSIPVMVKSVSVPVISPTVAPVIARTARATHPSASPPPPLSAPTVPLGGVMTAGSLTSQGSGGESATSKEGSITTQTEDLFNRVDTNGDGIIDRREFRRAIKTRVIVSSSHV